MEGLGFPAVDPRERDVPLTLDRFGDLIECLLRSGRWEEHPMVSRFFTLASLGNLRLLSSSAIIKISRRSMTQDQLRWLTFILAFGISTRGLAAIYSPHSLCNSLLVPVLFVTHTLASIKHTTMVRVSPVTEPCWIA